MRLLCHLASAKSLEHLFTHTAAHKFLCCDVVAGSRVEYLAPDKIWLGGHCEECSLEVDFMKDFICLGQRELYNFRNRE